MRHAQAAPAELGAEDFTRPLTAAGRRAAAQAARTLAASGVQLDRVLLSPARRTRETAAIVAGELTLAQTPLPAGAGLYGAPLGRVPARVGGPPAAGPGAGRWSAPPEDRRRGAPPA